MTELEWLIKLEMIPYEKRFYFFSGFIRLFMTEFYSSGSITETDLYSISKLAYCEKWLAPSSCNSRLNEIVKYFSQCKIRTPQHSEFVMKVFDTFFTQTEKNIHAITMVAASSNFIDGLIPFEWMSMFTRKEFEGMKSSLETLFKSENYLNGIITKDEINKILSFLKKIVYSKIDIKRGYNIEESYCRLLFSSLVSLVTSDFYKRFILDKKIDFKNNIECLLDETYAIFAVIIKIAFDKNCYNTDIKIWEEFFLRLLKMPPEKKSQMCMQYLNYPLGGVFPHLFRAESFANDYIKSVGSTKPTTQLCRTRNFHKR